jgi:hydantoinase/carbamoylase family amidase
MARLDQLARIGAAETGGITRLGLARAEQRACELVASWMAADGLEVSWDPAGNLLGRRRGGGGAAPEVWSGSHLDTVPGGGRLDGALGVLVALEAASGLAGEPLPATLAVCVFRDEEGVRFGRGTFGSRAVCGQLSDADLERRDADGVSVRAALSALGFMGLRAPQPILPGAFVEVHAEQGRSLVRAGAAIGSCTAITGMAGYDVTFVGESGHAGTLPMRERRDAFLAAASFALALRDAALARDDVVATIGEVRVADAAANAVPGRVAITVDVRAPEPGALEAVAEAVPELARTAAPGVAAELRRVSCDPPVPFSPVVRDALSAGAAAEGVELAELGSGSGHDAGVLATAGVAAGMLFVRTPDGASGQRAEAIDAADVEIAIAVLTRALRTLCGGAPSAA